jgi:hypothetical protein
VAVLGANATIESTVVRGIKGDADGQFGGRDIDLQSSLEGHPGRLTLQTSLIEETSNAGVLIFDSDATIESTLVRGIKQAVSTEGIFADGISVISTGGPTEARVTATQVASNARAGLLFVDSEGTISNVRGWSNRFGIVFQGSKKPTLDESSNFDGNLEQNSIMGGDLALPREAVPLP